MVNSPSHLGAGLRGASCCTALRVTGAGKGLRQNDPLLSSLQLDLRMMTEPGKPGTSPLQWQREADLRREQAAKNQSSAGSRDPRPEGHRHHHG
jgi:hypothetical protein